MTTISAQAVSGLQNAQKQLRDASQNIQKTLSASLNGETDNKAAQNVAPERALVLDIVDIKQAELSFKANARVLEKEQEIYGTLLDIKE